jgi:hypothetical protein
MKKELIVNRPQMMLVVLVIRNLVSIVYQLKEEGTKNILFNLRRLFFGRGGYAPIYTARRISAVPKKRTPMIIVA